MVRIKHISWIEITHFKLCLKSTLHSNITVKQRWKTLEKAEATSQSLNLLSSFPRRGTPKDFSILFKPGVNRLRKKVTEGGFPNYSNASLKDIQMSKLWNWNSSILLLNYSSEKSWGAICNLWAGYSQSLEGYIVTLHCLLYLKLICKIAIRNLEIQQMTSSAVTCLKIYTNVLRDLYSGHFTL